MFTGGEQGMAQVAEVVTTRGGTRESGALPVALGEGRPRRPWLFQLYGVGRGTIVFVHVVCFLFGLYIIVPLYWIIVASTKTSDNIVNTFGFWFAGPFHLFQNIGEVFTYNGALFSRWLGNTILYAGASGVLATLVAGLAGFVFAKYKFAGRRPIIGFMLGAVAIPAIALVVPLYLLFVDLHLVDNPLGMILPSLGGAFGPFLMYVYVRSSVSDEILDAARIDGAGEFRIFWRIGLPLMLPGSVTVLLFTAVGTWNNYFLPLLIFSKPGLEPVTVGLAQWNFTATQGTGTHILYSLVVAGGLVSMIPTVAAFLVLQRYWRTGLTVGSVRG